MVTPILFSLAAPALLLTVAGVAALGGAGPARRTAALAEAGALCAMLSAVCAGLFLWQAGGTAALMAVSGVAAVGVRLDAVSAVMLLLVGFIGWVVLRYSRTYLDGEAGHFRFTALMAGTLGAVLLLVQAGSLLLFLASWVAMSMGLRQLLLFYPDRPGAQRAAAKKRVFSRTGDVALAGGFACLLAAYGTGEVGSILAAARAGEGGVLAVLGAALLAGAAILKSAQLPFHGWLTEVMETPTPVSALLHAGIINAGGFLLIRFADVLLLAPGVLAVLALIGGLSALVAGLVMLTQSAVKTSLAWSTIAQMGFMILQCGLALFPLALLHIVAHSLYKAHAFLA
ncbi:MAG: proton-conducting transporter membrane subunit, partial [Sphingomonadaceae bacterium]